MNAVEEVKSFAREYVNNVSSRTPDRTSLINQAYRQVFGVNIRTGCGTCIVDAIFKILKSAEMEKCDYVLKPGVFRQGFGLKPLCKWTLTNELAEEYLKLDPGNAKYFSVMPEKRSVIVKPPFVAEKPKPTLPTVEAAQKMVNETINQVLDPKAKNSRKPSKRKVKKDVE